MICWVWDAIVQPIHRVLTILIPAYHTYHCHITRLQNQEAGDPPNLLLISVHNINYINTIQIAERRLPQLYVMSCILMTLQFYIFIVFTWTR